jgi:hypothetical protein
MQPFTGCSERSYVRTRRRDCGLTNYFPARGPVLADEFGSWRAALPQRPAAVRLLTRNGNDFADRVPLIADAIEAKPRGFRS